MKVKLLTDLTSYNPKFTRDAVGESNMHEYQREGQPWRTYVNVRIEGDMLPVGVDGVECLDNDYIRMKELQKKIEEKELLRQLKEAEKVIHAVGPAALIFTPGPICSLKSLTSSRVAPPVPKPVEVLI